VGKSETLERAYYREEINNFSKKLCSKMGWGEKIEGAEKIHMRPKKRVRTILRKY